jgi:hypothetical protein
MQKHMCVCVCMCVLRWGRLGSCRRGEIHVCDEVGAVIGLRSLWECRITCVYVCVCVC